MINSITRRILDAIKRPNADYRLAHDLIHARGLHIATTPKRICPMDSYLIGDDVLTVQSYTQIQFGGHLVKAPHWSLPAGWESLIDLDYCRDFHTAVYLTQCRTFDVAAELCGMDSRSRVSTVEGARQRPYCLRVVRKHRTADGQAFRNQVAETVRKRRQAYLPVSGEKT